jgi:uncharacterized protein (DUF2141 family)
MKEVKIMDMPKIIEMLRERQGERSIEVFAVNMGIASSTLRTYYKGTRSIGHENAKTMVAHFQELKDNEMAEAIRQYFNQKMAI